MATRTKRVSSPKSSLKRKLWQALENAYDMSIRAKPDWVVAHEQLRAAIRFMTELRKHRG